MKTDGLLFTVVSTARSSFNVIQLEHFIRVNWQR